jgi:hypothetical protein
VRFSHERIGPWIESKYLSRMNRLRSFTALLALLTFFAAFAEQVWASTCDGAMRMGSTPSHAQEMVGMEHTPAPSPHQDQTPRSPECPLAAALAANGGCIFTYHPAPALAPAPPLPLISSAVLANPADVPVLLLSRPQFRPPKP